MPRAIEGRIERLEALCSELSGARVRREEVSDLEFARRLAFVLSGPLYRGTSYVTDEDADFGLEIAERLVEAG